MRSDNRPQWIWFCGWLLLMCGVRLQSMDRGGVGGGSLGWGMVQAASREELLSTVRVLAPKVSVPEML